MRKLISTVLCSIFITNCGKKVEEKKPEQNLRIEELRGKQKENLKKAQEAWSQKTGWPSDDDCDGTLWAGLAKASGVNTVLLEKAKQADGKIHRRPTKPCWENGVDVGASSTISKDMLLGYVFGMWRSGNRGELESLFSYGKDHGWRMGDPASEVGKVFLTPNGIATLCKAIKSLGGDYKSECDLPTVFSSGSKDFEEHLAVLGIILWGEVNGGTIPADAYQTLTDLAYKHAQDALFNSAYAGYASGNFDVPTQLLLSDYSYPSYVRGNENYKLVHWLFAADLILRKFPL